MAKSFWKGVISFGLVAIPVKMYVATETRPVSFHLLHKKCLTRPKQVLHCDIDNEYFGMKDTVRGYEVSKDQYVVLDDIDFEKVPIKTSRAIDIQCFIDSKEIDPVYYYGSHYIEPEELGVKPFQLLRQALQKTGKVGIAKVTFQHREHLCCLRPLDEILALHTIHYQSEIIPREEIAAPEAKTTAAEMDMAVSLIKAMVKRFRPEEYHDEYQEALKKVVEAKAKGEKVVVPSVAKVEMVDLMQALRASVEATKTKS
jgi:DNA end-binding protein Ku